jgi:hypothetical protein
VLENNTMVSGIGADYILYGICLGLSLLLALVSALSGDLLEVDIDVEADVDTGGLNIPLLGDHGLPRYSLFNPVAFLTLLGGFGATGLVARGLGVGVWPALLVALGGGATLSFLVFQLFARIVLASEGASAPTIDAAIGKLATVTVTIPASGLGVVAYVVAGQRQTLPARHLLGEPIANGEEVVIVDLEHHIAIVRLFRKSE